MYKIEESRARNIYRKTIGIVVCCTLIFIISLTFIICVSEVPSDIIIRVNQDNNFSASIPLTASFNEECVGAISIDNKVLNKNNLQVNLEENYSIKGTKVGKYKADIKAFGFISLKKVNVEVVDNRKVIVGGFPVGIYIETDGLLVLGIGNVCGRDGIEYSPAKNIVKAGDYIIAINDIKVNNKQKFINYVQKAKEDDIKLTLRRNNKIINVAVKRIKCKDGSYKIGIWIRNNMQGIGTLTYYDKEKRKYGALGHGINDVDTNKLMEIKNGSLYNAGIIDVVPGMKDKPGELVGIINHSNSYRLGNLRDNTLCGIYGNVDIIGENNITYQVSRDKLKDELYVAVKKEVKRGKAIIRTQVDDKIREYDIMIEKINNHNLKGNKNFVIRIIDDELLGMTGGIVQGMSGSPIIQDGKMIGAVTHVFVNDPTKGYGIFIENMLGVAK